MENSELESPNIDGSVLLLLVKWNSNGCCFVWKADRVGSWKCDAPFSLSCISSSSLSVGDGTRNVLLVTIGSARGNLRVNSGARVEANVFVATSLLCVGRRLCFSRCRWLLSIVSHTGFVLNHKGDIHVIYAWTLTLCGDLATVMVSPRGVGVDSAKSKYDDFVRVTSLDIGQSYFRDGAQSRALIREIWMGSMELL